VIHELLSAALKQATSALEGDDAVAAAAALEQATHACEAALRQRLRFDRDQLGVLRALHDRCTAAAQRAGEKLALAMGAAGDARRAVSAYRR
jgi:hypothetical protein